MTGDVDVIMAAIIVAVAISISTVSLHSAIEAGAKVIAVSIRESAKKQEKS